MVENFNNPFSSTNATKYQKKIEEGLENYHFISLNGF
jgi:hypothetical protein